jgi:hypothetical protein
VTEEKSAALVGQLVLEQQSLDRKISILKVEAARIGRIFSSIGRQLENSPKNLYFEGQSDNPRIINEVEVKTADIHLDGLLKITNELRADIARRDEIAVQLKSIGVDLTHA